MEQEKWDRIKKLCSIPVAVVDTSGVHPNPVRGPKVKKVGKLARGKAKKTNKEFMGLTQHQRVLLKRAHKAVESKEEAESK